MKLKIIVLPVLLLSLLGCRMAEKVPRDIGSEFSAPPTSPSGPPPPVAITNISVEPESVPNDGNALITIRCTVAPTPSEAVRRVWLDLRHTTLPEELTLEPVVGEFAINTFAGTLRIPDLLDTGRYGVPLLAEDTQGRQGSAETEFRVAYHRGKMPRVSSPRSHEPANSRVISQGIGVRVRPRSVTTWSRKAAWVQQSQSCRGSSKCARIREKIVPKSSSLTLPKETFRNSHGWTSPSAPK